MTYDLVEGAIESHVDGRKPLRAGFLQLDGATGEAAAKTVNRERLTIEAVLEDNHSLKAKRENLFLEAYRLARREAAFETNLPLDAFPIDPPFELAQSRSQRFWPRGFPLKRPTTSGKPRG